MTYIGARIREARQRYGMSQAELARRVKISKTAMNDIEQGQTTYPRVDIVYRIARTLHVTMESFLTEETTP